MAGHSNTDRKAIALESLALYLPVTAPISDIILILDRCTVYRTRIAYHRRGISCTLRHFELVHSQCMQ